MGKTVQVISLLSGLVDLSKIKTVLIVMPASLINNWEDEFYKWCPGLTVLTFHGNPLPLIKSFQLLDGALIYLHADVIKLPKTCPGPVSKRPRTKLRGFESSYSYPLSDNYRSYTFKPPYNHQSLSLATQRQNGWLTGNKIGLEWKAGLTPCYKLRQCLEASQDVYTKCLEKATFLEDFLERMIFDFNEFECIKITDEDRTLRCINKHSARTPCAYEKCLFYSYWAIKNV